MPDSDYQPDEESVELARKLAYGTTEDIRRQRESSNEPEPSTVSLERRAQELGIDAPMRDMTFVLEEFVWQWELARKFDGRMPCVQIGEGEKSETIPLSMSIDWPFPWAFRSLRYIRRFYPFPADYLFEAYREALRSRSESEGISFESADNVLKRLQSGLENFLAYRIAGFQAWVGWVMGSEQSGRGNFGGKGGRKPPGGRSGSGGPPPPASWSPGGGLQVEMSCNTPGLTIEFSHAYFIHFLNFGAPSFPVKNMLHAGRYVFQGKGPTYPSGTPRTQVFRIPPDYKAVTTYF